MRKYIKKLKSVIFIKVLSGSLYIAAIASIPYIIKSLIDYDFSKGSKGIILLILLYLLVSAAGMGFQYITQSHAWKFSKLFHTYVKSDVFNKILQFNTPKYNETEIGTYISMLDNEVPVVEEYYSSGVTIIESSISIIIYGIYMLLLDPIIAFVIIVFSSLTLFLPNITSKELTRRRGVHLESTGNYLSIVKDLLSGFKHNNYGTRNYIHKEHDKSLDINESNMLKYGKFNTFVNVFNGFFMYLIDISAFGLVGFLLLNNRISYGVAMATLVYIKEFVYPIRYLIMDITRMKSSKGIKDKIERFLDQETEINKPAKCLSNDINFIDVSIQFPDFSLNNFNYTFRRGKKYAIIGESGSGKSTILNLLTKNIEPDSGDIEIDGISIKSIDPSSIIGCIGQSEHVFKTNFRNNATIFGAYSDLSMRNSLEFLDCKKLNGIQDNTDSSTLSGGEKQLLALTQMAITNRNILLLDEPFSALDKKNTLLMEERFFGLDDRTLIVVSHNLSEKNLGYFDEVLHMKNGVLISQSDNVNEVSGNITSLC